MALENTCWADIWEDVWLDVWASTTSVPDPYADDLRHSPAEVVRQLLVDEGLCTDHGPALEAAAPWPAYATNEPDNPDDCVTVFDTQGQDDGRVMSDGQLQQHYGVQVRVRSASHGPVGGWRKAREIRTGLSKEVYRQDVTVTDEDGTASRYMVHALTRIGMVLPIGRDKPSSHRDVYTINMTVVVVQYED